MAAGTTDNAALRRPWACIRPQLLREAAGQLFDVAVVGGGVTGAAVAREATLAGLRVALFEAGDFAGGTSSRSTKIFHGGLRYLRNLEFGLVRDAGRERERMSILGPHLVRRVPMVLPVYRGGPYGPSTLNAAVWVYDALAGVPRRERRRFLGSDALLGREPLASADGLLGGVLYHEYVTDDARATLAVLQSAIDGGALALNHCPVTALSVERGRVAGVVVRDALDRAGTDQIVAARLVVAAAGPWAEAVSRLDPDGRAAPSLAGSRGSHIAFARERLPVRDAWSVPTSDGRLVFVIPRHEATYVGTTDEGFTGDLRHPPVPEADVAYLLAAVNRQFPSVRLGRGDVIGQWAGVRPLVRQPGRAHRDTSRRDRIWISQSGLVGIAGGKLTGWRHMGQEVLDVLRREWARRGRGEGWPEWPAAWTAYVRRSKATGLPGAPPTETPGAADDFAAYATAEGLRMAREVPVDPDTARTLVARYGSEAADLGAGAGLLPVGVQPWSPIVAGVPLLGVELARFLTRDQAVRLADVVVRRTGLGWFGGRAAVAALPVLAACMGAMVGWSREQEREEIRNCFEEAYWLERDLYRAEAERMLAP